MSPNTSSRRPNRTAVEVHQVGLKALLQALGVADTARFLQQYGLGLGDYTAEREALLDEMSREDVHAWIKRFEDKEGE